MSEVVGRTQCPKCLDSGRDNLVEYSDGSYCFACGYTDKEEMENTTEITGQYRDIRSRGLSKRTCEKFGYSVRKNDNGGYDHIADYYDHQGNKVNQKLRTPDKQMYFLKRAKNFYELFGQQLWTPSKKISVIVTEGEIDAMSVYEVMGRSYPVVSVPNGATAAVKVLKNQIEWLSGFKQVLLAFDNDEAGREAEKKCVDLFEPGIAKVVKWSKKDANELLLAGEHEQIKIDIWSAKEVRPDGIVGVESLLGDINTPPTRGLSWPWKELTDITYGIRMNEIYTLGAGSGIGKTEFLSNIILHLANVHKEKVGAMFLEQKPQQTLLRIIGNALNKRLHIPGTMWDVDAINKVANSLKDKIYFYDHFGGQDFNIIAAKIRYFVKALGCRFIIIDHITALAVNMKDERREIDIMMSKLGSLVQELNCSFFIVSHLSKPTDGQKSYEEGRPVFASSFRGSQSIQYWSSFMLGLERNKMAKDPAERKITKLRVLKDRFSGEADGYVLQLKYNTETGKLEPYTNFKEVI